jgi:alpha-glucosidase
MDKWAMFGCLVMVCLVMTGSKVYGQEHELISPGGKIKVLISVGDRIRYSVYYGSEKLLEPSAVSLSIADVGVLGENPKLIETTRVSRREIIRPVVPTKSAEILNEYNELTLIFQSNFSLVFRAYDDGIAWRFVTTFDHKIKVLTEEARFAFAGDHNVYYPTETDFLTHSERLYEYIPLSQVSRDKKSCLPALVDVAGGPKVAVTEADLEDYPGMYLSGESSATLFGIFPAVALKEEQTNDRTVKVLERADYIAETGGDRSFPWRVLVIAENDGDLLENQMVYKLAEPLQLQDTAWIRPGKIAWDWWNANNIYGVDFEAGINTETYKYYIDFASKYGIEYVILDEGWYELGDLFKINPAIDMEELLSYAERKNVGIILWVVWKTLDNQLTDALDRFEKWGVKGIKVDFMQRDDQWMVNYYRKIAAEAAKRFLLVDFHGSYKPTGLRRAYPNVLTREGVRGLEHNKWSEHPSPEHNVTIPFIRMLAGPMDYTPGAMINAQQKDFKPIFNRPMSMGTRCHQMAMYVVYESPLQMLADSPSNYLREPECTEFIARVPTVWDETRALDAKVGDYVLVARRMGDVWYVGAMTDWSPRELTLSLSFLPAGEYRIEIFQDGPNAHRHGNDYKRVYRIITHRDSVQIKLAPGGGWVARIESLLAPGD